MLGNEQKLCGYDGLRYAIVMLAARDYKRALKYIEKHEGEDSTYMNQMKSLKSSCEVFFRGKWYRTICHIDGERFIKEIPHLEGFFRGSEGEVRDAYV